MIGSREKLAAMRVLMAVRALCVRHRSFEIAVRVASGAFDCAVLAKQREIRLRVIEIFELRDARPTGGVVAGLAGSREASLMGIRVATGALVEGKSRVLHIGFNVGNRNVTFFAG